MSTTLIIGLILFSLAYFLALFLILNRARKAADRSARATSRIEEFFVSGRDLRLGRAVATLGATEIGLITIAYNAQKGFNEGFSAFHIGIAALVGCALVGLTGFVVTPLRREKVLTIPEYYGKRYGQDIRILGATVTALGGILNMGLFLKVASLFILALLGIEGPSWTVTAMMVGLVAVAVAYTCFGGMRSVIATDVFQFIIMTVALIGAAVVLTWLMGLDATIEAVSRTKGEAGFNPVVNDSFGIDYIMWMVFVAGVVSSAIWPTALSRALCIERSEDVARTYLVSSLIFMGRMVLPAFLGVIAIAYFNAPPPEIAGATGASAASPAPSASLPSSYGEDADSPPSSVDGSAASSDPSAGDIRPGFDRGERDASRLWARRFR